MPRIMVKGEVFRLNQGLPFRSEGGLLEVYYA